MKKIFTLIMLFMILLMNGISSINYADAKALNKYGVTKISPYYIYTNDGAFGTLPAILNPSNLSESAFTNRNCSKIKDDDRMKYNVPYGMIGMKCNWNKNGGYEMAQILKEVKVANMVGFSGGIMLDASSSRFYLVKKRVEVDEKNIIIKGDDIYYVDNNLDSDSQFIIYDPDLSNKSSNQKTFETAGVFGLNNDDERPTMSANLYMLDSSRIDSKMLKKGFYTMEHFLGKKYNSNNGSSLRTTSYDGLRLYDLTYFNEHMVGATTYYKYCNGDLDNISDNVYNEILRTGEDQKEFQRRSSSMTVKDRRSSYCSKGTSGLRVNKSINSSLMTSNGSIKFKYGYITYNSSGNKIPEGNSAAQNCDGDNSKPFCYAQSYAKGPVSDTEYTAFFEPEKADGAYAYINLPSIGVIGNKKLMVAPNIDTTNNTAVKNFLDGKTVDLYYIVKLSLINRNPVDSSTSGLKSPLKEDENYYKDGFDPTDKNWYEYGEHLNGREDPVYVEEYISTFGGKNLNSSTKHIEQCNHYDTTCIGGAGQGNMYIPLTRNASFYNISTPGYTSAEFGESSKMNNRSKSIALTASQGYIQTETGDGNNKTTGNSFGVTSYGSIDLGSLLDGSKILVLRNFDADSKKESADSGGYFDGNVSSKISIIYTDINPLKKLAVVTNLEGYLQDAKITNNTSNCKNKYGFNESDTYAIYGTSESASDREVKECGYTGYRDAAILSGNAKSGQLKKIQETLEGEVKIDNTVTGDVSFIISTVFENVNDTTKSGGANYNQINTTTNYLENLTNNLDCSISISKAFNNSSGDYKTWLQAQEDITNKADYDYNGTAKVFSDNISSPFLNDQSGFLTKFHFQKEEISSIQSEMQNFYTDNSTLSDWLIGDKGVVTYQCDSIEPGHNLELFVYSDNIKYNNNGSTYGAGGNFSHGNTIISFNPDSTKTDKLYDYVGAKGLSGEISDGDGIILKQDESAGGTNKLTYFYDTYGDSKDPVAIDIDSIISANNSGFNIKARGGVTFNVTGLTDSLYGKVTAVLIDQTTGDAIATKHVLLGVKNVQKPLEYTDASKNEQDLTSGYDSKDVGFNGTTYGMNFTVTNTKAKNAEYPSAASAGGINIMILGGYNYINQKADKDTFFPIFSKIDSTCSADADYVCDDGTRTQQDTSKFFEILDSKGEIKIIETQGANTTEHIAVAGSGPENGKWVYKLVTDSNSGEKYIGLYLPKDKNYYEANTSYTIQMQIPTNSFVGAGLGENITKTDKDALTIVPTLVYYDSANKKKYIWDVGTSALDTNNLYNNFYYRWKVDNSSAGGCLVELTSGPEAQYLSGNGYHVFVGEEGAKKNGKSCSDSDVRCLLQFEAVATDSNIHNDSSKGYSGINVLGDDDMKIGDSYDLLVKMIANGQTAAHSNGDLEEGNIHDAPLEMDTKLSYNGNIDVERGIVANEVYSSGLPIGLLEDTGLSSKSFTLQEIFNANGDIQYYDNNNSKWRSTANDDYNSDGGLKYYRTNLPTPKYSTQPFYRSTSNASGNAPDDRATYMGVQSKITGSGKTKADIEVTFGDKNVPDAIKNETCKFSVEFPEPEKCQVAKPKVSRFELSAGEVQDYDATDYDDFIDATDSVADDLNDCGKGDGDDRSFFIERENYKYDNNGDPTAGVVVYFRVANNSTCGTGDFSRANGTDVTIKVKITDQGKDIRKCLTNVDHTSLRRSGDYITIEGVEIKAGKHKNIEVSCAFNERDADCSEDNHEVEVEVSNVNGSDDDGDGEFKKCMLPTLKIEDDAEVDDENSANDFHETFTVAYPFEFKECDDKVTNEWRVKYEGGCGVTDPGFKDFEIVWLAGQNRDDTGGNREFIHGLSAYKIRGVTPTINGHSSVVWDFNNANLNDILDSVFKPVVKIYPIKDNIGLMKLRANGFYVKVNRPDLIKVEIDTQNTGNVDGGNDMYISRGLSSAIGANPTVGNEQVYDLGLYTNPNIRTVVMHKEEINGTSKKGSKTGAEYREPMIYQVDVANPSVNANYGLNNLNFNLHLNAQGNLLDIVDTTQPNTGNTIYTGGGSGGWLNERTTAGHGERLKGYFLVNKTLRSKADPDYGTPYNPVIGGIGHPSLEITGASCQYTEPFNTWKFEIIENPLVTNTIDYDDPDPTPDGGNQHLPGDIMTFKVELENINNQMDFENIFVELRIDANDTITDTNLILNDLSEYFEFVGGPTGYTDPNYNVPLYDINGGKENCGFVPKNGTEGPRIICYLNEKIEKETTYVLNIPMRIKIGNDLYDKLKASTVDEKYWYPIKINEIRYGTATLNILTHQTNGNIVYYTSYMNVIPSGDMMGDVINDDINDPNNTTVSAEPDDGRYNFYIGMPYMDVDTRVINTSIGHFSPGDIIEFKTKAWSKSKAYVRDPKIIQKLFEESIMDFVDVQIIDMSYTADKTNFNTQNKIIHVTDRNQDTDPTNDLPTRNITEINLLNDISGATDVNIHANTVNLFSDGPIAAYYEGVADPATETGGEVEITSKVKIVKLKRVKRPQIGCGISETIGCVRGVDEGTNPKPDKNVGAIDLYYVGDNEDERDEEPYEVYFPILKSMLFQQQNDSYIPTPGSNNIRGVINDPNTEVVYRVDNFIPSAYDPVGTGVGKARQPIGFIRLPVGVKYTENSAVVIEDLSDDAPYGNEVAIGDPIETSKTDYEDEVDDGTSTYDGDLDDEDPDGDLLPDADDMAEEENNRCLYGDGEFGFCILSL